MCKHHMSWTKEMLFFKPGKIIKGKKKSINVKSSALLILKKDSLSIIQTKKDGISSESCEPVQGFISLKTTWVPIVVVV